MASRVLATALIVGLVGALAACGSSSSSTSSSPSASTSGAASTTAAAAGKKPNIAYLNITSNPYGSAEIRGVKSTGAKLTAFSSNFDPQKLLSQCQDAVNSGRYNVLIVGSADGASAIPCARLAAAKKIPVLATVFPISKNLEDLEPTTPGVMGQVVTIPSADTQLELKEIKAACAGANPCPVLYDIVNPYSPLSQSTLAYLKAHPDEAAGIKIVGKWSSNYDPAQTQKNLPPLLRAHPNVKVVYAADDVGAASIPAMLKRAGVKAKVVTNGYSSLAADAIKAGTIQSTVIALPFSSGQKLGEMANAVVNGKPIDETGVDNLKLGPPSGLVDKQNVDEVKPQY
jgi:ribose transport system substrate-binding protein